MGQWGPYPYRPGGQRDGCQSGPRTCHDLTATLWHRNQRPLAAWLRATLL
jgi:hypothetical protein